MIKVMGDTWDAEEHHPAPPPLQPGNTQFAPHHLHPSQQHLRRHLPNYQGRLPNLAGAAQPAVAAVGMEGLSVGSVLLTGCDGGLGLGLLKGLLEQPTPPQHLFAACLDPQGKVRRVLRGGQLRDGLGDTVPGGAAIPTLL